MLAADAVPATAGDSKDLGENLQQTAFICLVCKYMSLTESDMKSHVREKHKVKPETDGGASGMNLLNLFCVII